MPPGPPADPRDRLDVGPAVGELQRSPRGAGRAMEPHDLLLAAADVVAEWIAPLLALAQLLLVGERKLRKGVELEVFGQSPPIQFSPVEHRVVSNVAPLIGPQAPLHRAYLLRWQALEFGMEHGVGHCCRLCWTCRSRCRGATFGPWPEIKRRRA
jgi:hypothetical protein